MYEIKVLLILLILIKSKIYIIFTKWTVNIFFLINTNSIFYNVRIKLIIIPYFKHYFYMEFNIKKNAVPLKIVFSFNYN